MYASSSWFSAMCLSLAMSEVAKSFNFKLAEFGRIGEDCVGEPEKEAGGEGWVVEEAVCRICDVIFGGREAVAVAVGFAAERDVFRHSERVRER